MVSCTFRCSFEPPVTLVIASLGLTSGTAPHGADFCGSPRSLSTIQDAGSSSLKCACTPAGTATAMARATASGIWIDFIVIPLLDGFAAGWSIHPGERIAASRWTFDAFITIRVPGVLCRWGISREPSRTADVCGDTCADTPL